jgi:hypothetical protein
MEIKDEERMAMIPLISHELGMARLERCHEADVKELTKSSEKLTAIIKWLIAVIVILTIVIGIGVYEFMSYDYADITVDSNDGSNAAYMGDGASGVINNGQSSSQEESQEE